LGDSSGAEVTFGVLAADHDPLCLAHGCSEAWHWGEIESVEDELADTIVTLGILLPDGKELLANSGRVVGLGDSSIDSDGTGFHYLRATHQLGNRNLAIGGPPVHGAVVVEGEVVLAPVEASADGHPTVGASGLGGLAVTLALVCCLCTLCPSWDRFALASIAIAHGPLLSSGAVGCLDSIAGVDIHAAWLDSSVAGPWPSSLHVAVRTRALSVAGAVVHVARGAGLLYSITLGQRGRSHTSLRAVPFGQGSIARHALGVLDIRPVAAIVTARVFGEDPFALPPEWLSSLVEAGALFAWSAITIFDSLAAPPAQLGDIADAFAATSVRVAWVHDEIHASEHLAGAEHGVEVTVDCSMAAARHDICGAACRVEGFVNGVWGVLSVGSEEECHLLGFWGWFPGIVLSLVCVFGQRTISEHQVNVLAACRVVGRHVSSGNTTSCSAVHDLRAIFLGLELHVEFSLSEARLDLDSAPCSDQDGRGIR